MKKNFYIILFFYLFISPANAKIVYIDIKYILNSSEVGISLNNYISGISEKNNIKFKKLEEDLIKKEKNLIIQQIPLVRLLYNSYLFLHYVQYELDCLKKCRLQ